MWGTLMPARDRSILSILPSIYDRAVTRRPNVEKLKANRDLRGLARALDSRSSPAIVKAAAEALGQVTAELDDSAASARVAEPLIGALSSDEWQVREAAALALGHVGARLDDSRLCIHTIEALVVALDDGWWAVRRAATTALSKIGTAAYDPLITTLRGGEWRARQAAAGALGQLGESQAIPSVIAALQDEEWRVRASAAETLGLLAGHAGTQEETAQVVEPLTSSLGDEWWGVRKASTGALASVGAPAIPRLVHALEADRWQVREGAAAALGEMKVSSAEDSQDPDAAMKIVQPLATSLNDTDGRVRRAATRALGELGAQMEGGSLRARVVRLLAGTLNDSDGRVREAAAIALGRTGDAQAAEALTGVLSDDTEGVRQAAASALDRLARTQGIQAV